MIESIFRVIAVGDISLNGKYHRRLLEKGPAYPFLQVRDDWRSAAIRIGNLESPISSHERVAASKFTLRASPHAAESLRWAGFDCVSLANNHMMDFGPSGLLETCERLDTAGIARVGAGRNLNEAMAPVILHRDGLSIGTLAFCDVEQVSPLYATTGTAGVAPAELDACRNAIKSLRHDVDWLVVHMHWGMEMSRLPSPAQRCCANALIGAGADVVIGHHPHVIQPVESFERGIAAYSLGDFTFSNAFWHGINGGGMPFLGHYQVHPLSRRTGWLEIDFMPGRRPAATFRPAMLKRDLRVVPHEMPARQQEWRELNRLLDHPDYRHVFETEASRASQRAQWRMSGRRPIPRLKLKLLEYGCFPGMRVEPDGAGWRENFGRPSCLASAPSPA